MDGGPRLHVHPTARALSAPAAVRAAYRLDDHARHSWAHLQPLFASDRRYLAVSDEQWLVQDWLRRIVRENEVYSLPFARLDDLPLGILAPMATHAFGGNAGADREAAAALAVAGEERTYFVVTDLRSRRRKRAPTVSDDLRASAVVEFQAEWRPARSDAAVSLHSFEPAREVDLVALAPWHLWRHSLRHWPFCGPSDAEGCLEYGPPAAPPVPGDHDVRQLPAVVVFERLCDLGWRATRADRQPHLDPEDLSLDLSRGIVASVPYGRCLLVLDTLLERGLPGLHCRQSPAYYDACLRLPNLAGVLPGLSGRQYGDLVRAAPSGALGLAPRTPPRSPAADDLDMLLDEGPLAALGDADEPAAARDAIEWDAEPLPALGAPPAAPAAPVGAVGLGLPDRERVPEHWRPYVQMLADSPVPLRVAEVPLSVECFFRTTGQGYVRVICHCPHHGGACVRRRSATFSRRYGVREIISYLGAWVDAGAGLVGAAATQQHVLMRIGAEQTDAYATAQGWL